MGRLPKEHPETLSPEDVSELLGEESDVLSTVPKDDRPTIALHALKMPSQTISQLTGLSEELVRASIKRYGENVSSLSEIARIRVYRSVVWASMATMMSVMLDRKKVAALTPTTAMGIMKSIPTVMRDLTSMEKTTMELLKERKEFDFGDFGKSLSKEGEV